VVSDPGLMPATFRQGETAVQRAIQGEMVEVPRSVAMAALDALNIRALERAGAWPACALADAVAVELAQAIARYNPPIDEALGRLGTALTADNDGLDSAM